MFELSLESELSISEIPESPSWTGPPGARLDTQWIGLNQAFAVPQALGFEPGNSAMLPNELNNTLEKVLVERLCDFWVARPGGPFRIVRTAINRIHLAVQGKRRISPNSPRYPEVVSRVGSLPEQVKEILRRHYVFMEAEESICLSLKMTPKQFQSLRREAVDYVLMRRRFRQSGTGFSLPDSCPPIPGQANSGQSGRAWPRFRGKQ